MNMFSNAIALQAVVIKDGVTEIETFVFGNIPTLHTVIIPRSVVTISGSAFNQSASVIVYTEYAKEEKPDGWASQDIFSNSITNAKHTVWNCRVGFELEDITYNVDGTITVIVTEPSIEDNLSYQWYVSHFGGAYEIIEGATDLNFTFDLNELGATYACRAILAGVILHEFVYRPDATQIVSLILGKITALQEEIAEIISAIGAHTEEIEGLGEGIANLGEEIGALGESVAELEGEVGELVLEIEGLGEDIEKLSMAVGEFEGKIEDLETQILAIMELLENAGEVDLSELSTAIGEIVKSVADLSGEMDEINGIMKTQGELIAERGESILAIEQKIAEIIATNLAQDESIEALQQKILELETQIAALIENGGGGDNGALLEKIRELEEANAAMWEAMMEMINNIEIPELPVYPGPIDPVVPQNPNPETGEQLNRVGNIFVYSGFGIFAVVFILFIWFGLIVAARALRSK
jgi:uncharacterized coiled-coil DUF342 family protein